MVRLSHPDDDIRQELRRLFDKWMSKNQAGFMMSALEDIMRSKGDDASELVRLMQKWLASV